MFVVYSTGKYYKINLFFNLESFLGSKVKVAKSTILMPSASLIKNKQNIASAPCICKKMCNKFNVSDRLTKRCHQSSDLGTYKPSTVFFYKTVCCYITALISVTYSNSMPIC